MFLERRNPRINPPTLLLLLITLVITLTACSAPKGSIVILEKPNEAEFSMEFNEWSSNNKCELALNKGDELQIEVIRENGRIALEICGKNGSVPYTGNNLISSIFTVKVAETDTYEIRITGKMATGKVLVKRI